MVESPLRAVPVPSDHHRRAHLGRAQLERPSAPPISTPIAGSRPRRHASPRRGRLRFTAAAPLVLTTPCNDAYVNEFAVVGNTLSHPLGSKPGSQAAGGAPPFLPYAPCAVPCQEVEEGGGFFPKTPSPFR